MSGVIVKTSFFFFLV